jgi:hypothetical protein
MRIALMAGLAGLLVRVGGALWMLAGLICAALFVVVFVGENLQDLRVLLEHPVLPALVAGAGLVAWTLGPLLIVRPRPSVVRWSNVAGVAWLIIFGTLVLTRLDQPGPRTSTSLITVFGVAGAFVVYLSSVGFSSVGGGRQDRVGSKAASATIDEQTGE